MPYCIDDCHLQLAPFSPQRLLTARSSSSAEQWNELEWRALIKVRLLL